MVHDFKLAAKISRILEEYEVLSVNERIRLGAQLYKLMGGKVSGREAKQIESNINDITPRKRSELKR